MKVFMNVSGSHYFASFAPGFSLIPGSCSGDPFLYLHRLARHLLGYYFRF
jgi:hypothetical protein